MLQLSHRARVRTQPGFICASCRHILSQPQRQQLQSTTFSISPPLATSVGVAALSSSATTTNPRSHRNHDLFAISRPFSTTNGRCEDETDEPPHATAGVQDEVPSKDIAGGEGEKNDRASDDARQAVKEAVKNVKALLKETPVNEAQVDIAWKKLEDVFTQGLSHLSTRKRTSLAFSQGLVRLTCKHIRLKNRVQEAEGEETNPDKGSEEMSDVRSEAVRQVLKMAHLDEPQEENDQPAHRTEPQEENDQPAHRTEPREANEQPAHLTRPQEEKDNTTQPSKKRGRKSTSSRLFDGVEPTSVSPGNLQLEPLKKKQPPVPRLSYGLTRVLFNPGVYHLQDPRTRVYNFDPYIARIMPIKEFDFGALKAFVTSSKDTTLIGMAAEHGRKYTGSTSSMTAMLTHFHFLISAWRPIFPLAQSRFFEPTGNRMGRILSAPSAAFLQYKDGVYAIDADKEFDVETVLSKLGHSMEKLLTVTKEEYEKYRKRNSSAHLSKKKRKQEQDTYEYTALGDFLMRSQLDAYDPRLPGNGTFDLKTRAVASIRYMSKDIKSGLGYEIRNRFGQWESYEREYFDLIRNAFMKYSLQVRIGRMDGCFVAYHNTERIFGFQYIPLSEMDQAIHGTPHPTLGDQEFKLSVHLLNQVLDRATQKYPKQSLRLHVEARRTTPSVMYIFAEPVTPEQIAKVQESNRKQAEEFEREWMGVKEEIEKAETDPSEFQDEGDELDVEGGAHLGAKDMAAWEDMMERVDEVLEDEERGLTAVRESIASALLESGMIDDSDSKKSRRYIHALVQALTSNETEPVKSESQTPPSLTGVEASESDPAVAIDAAAPLDSESQGSEMGNETPTTDEASIKDLILRLASQAKVKPAGQRPQESEQVADRDVNEYNPKLQKFMGILSELVSKDDQTADELDTQEQEKQAAVEEQERDDKEKTPAEELIGMILTIKNKVNGEYVDRPHDLRPDDKWEVEYVIEEMDDERAQTIYRQVRKRRREALGPDNKGMDISYKQALMKRARMGRRFRQKETREAMGQPVHVYGMNRGQPFSWRSVFQKHAFRSLKGRKLPIGSLKYKSFVPAGGLEPGQKWEDTEARNVWAEWMKKREMHVPVFESTSAYWEHDPSEEKQKIQYSWTQAQMKALEKKLRRMETQYEFLRPSEEAPVEVVAGKGNDIREASETGGEMLGLSVNDLPAEEEEEDAQAEKETEKKVEKIKPRKRKVTKPKTLTKPKKPRKQVKIRRIKGKSGGGKPKQEDAEE
ncbi:Mitochondrial protein Pet127 domain containing protein [Naviculisporaceae sp. PSN 640]